LIDKLTKNPQSVPAQRSMFALRAMAAAPNTQLPATELEAHKLRVLDRRARHERKP
jgi:hypothetical protein